MQTLRTMWAGVITLMVLGAPGAAAVVQAEEAGSMAFPTGYFEATDGHWESVRLDADGTCAWFGPGWEMPCTYAVNGDLFTETSYEGSMKGKFPATYRWAYDGEELSFELWGEDSNRSRYESYANHAYSLAEDEMAATPGETAAVAAEETGFPTGAFAPADDPGLSLVLGEDGRWSDSLGAGGAYGVSGDLWAEMTHDRPGEPQVPATYRWDWDGGKLTFEPWSRDDNASRVSAYADQAYVRAEE